MPGRICRQQPARGWMRYRAHLFSNCPSDSVHGPVAVHIQLVLAKAGATDWCRASAHSRKTAPAITETSTGEPHRVLERAGGPSAGYEL